MTVSFHKGCYGVGVASSPSEVAACQRLRQQIFFGKAGRDIEAYDAFCDHIMIADATGLKATFRVRLFGTGAGLDLSYAGARYDLRRLSGFPGPMLELGRFCIAPQAAQADVLRLAWGALAQIVDEADVAFLFGCTSFPGTNPRAHDAAFSFLAKKAAAPAQWAPGIRAPDVVPLSARPAAPDPGGLPPLLRSYLTLGGWVSDHAVVDHAMNTLHVFTGLEVAAIPPRRASALRAVAGVGASGGDI